MIWYICMLVAAGCFNGMLRHLSSFWWGARVHVNLFLNHISCYVSNLILLTDDLFNACMKTFWKRGTADIRWVFMWALMAQFDLFSLKFDVDKTFLLMAETYLVVILWTFEECYFRQISLKFDSIIPFCLFLCELDLWTSRYCDYYQWFCFDTLATWLTNNQIKKTQYIKWANSLLNCLYIIVKC